MANQITDNRTLVVSCDSATPFDDLSGAAAGNLDTEIKIAGTGSIGENVTNTRNGVLYDAGSAQDWSSNVFYLWINCGLVGLLDTKANGGFTIRFCGATVTDWFEVYVGGGDSWPPSIEGGWTQFVVDIETARSTAVTNGWTNGTAPATSAIRYVGWTGITASVMTRMLDNTWLDEIRRLPDGSPGIIVEGRNGGSADWSSADIASQLGNAVGTFVQAAGASYKVNTPIQFGINDTTTHGFTDTNATWEWDNQEFLPDDVYRISALGNAGGTTNVTFGVKTGTGDDATGAQGLVVEAVSTGARWDMDFDDANLDAIGLYGCKFQHGGNFQLDSSALEAITCIYLDCSKAVISNSLQQGNAIIAANTADGVAFMETDDLGDVAFCQFEFSDGHGVEIISGGPSTQNSKGNAFTGYLGTAGSNLVASSGSTDAAIYNSAGAARTIDILNGGDTPSVRNAASSTTTVNNSVSITLNDLIAGSTVYIFNTTDSAQIAKVVEPTTTFTTSVNFTGNKSLLIRVRKHSGAPYYQDFSATGTLTSNGFSLNVNQILDE